MVSLTSRGFCVDFCPFAILATFLRYPRSHLPVNFHQEIKMEILMELTEEQLKDVAGGSGTASFSATNTWWSFVRARDRTSGLGKELMPCHLPLPVRAAARSAGSRLRWNRRHRSRTPDLTCRIAFAALLLCASAATASVSGQTTP
jgi:hypothetical protein